MKCPRCAYLVYDDPGSCPNCGADLSLALDRSDDVDAGLISPPPDGPLIDLTLGSPEGETVTSAGHAPSASRSEPPLLPFPTGRVRKPPPLGPPRAPLSVRRKTPEVPRLRTPSPRAGSAELAIDFDSETVGQVESRARALPGAPSTLPSRAIAPLGLRVFAAAIDALIVAGIAAIVLYFTRRLTGLPPVGVDILPLTPLTVFLALLGFGYYAGLTGAGGQTIGKMAAGIRVVRADGDPLSWTTASCRTLAALGSAATCGAGFAAALFTSDRVTLHDRLCKTRVVKSLV